MTMDIISKVVTFDKKTTKDIKKNFKFLYVERGYTLKYISDNTGIPLGTILHLASLNQRGFSGEKLVKIGKLFNIKPEEFLLPHLEFVNEHSGYRGK